MQLFKKVSMDDNSYIYYNVNDEVGPCCEEPPYVINQEGAFVASNEYIISGHSYGTDTMW